MYLLNPDRSEVWRSPPPDAEPTSGTTAETIQRMRATAERQRIAREAVRVWHATLGHIRISDAIRTGQHIVTGRNGGRIGGCERDHFDRALRQSLIPALPDQGETYRLTLLVWMGSVGNLHSFIRLLEDNRYRIQPDVIVRQSNDETVEEW